MVDVRDELLLPLSQGSGRHALVARTQGSCELSSHPRSWETSGLEGRCLHAPPPSYFTAVESLYNHKDFLFPRTSAPKDVCLKYQVWIVLFFLSVDMLTFCYLSVCVCVENGYVGVHATARVEDRG